MFGKLQQHKSTYSTIKACITLEQRAFIRPRLFLHVQCEAGELLHVVVTRKASVLRKKQQEDRKKHSRIRVQKEKRLSDDPFPLPDRL